MRGIVIMKNWARVKKLLSILLASVVLGCMAPQVASAFPDLPLRIVINGDKVDFNNGPKALKDQQGCVMVPMDFIKDALTAKVDWSDSGNTATISLDKNQAVYTAGQKDYLLNGMKKTMNNTVNVIDGTPYFPLLQLCSDFGIKTKLDDQINTIYITDFGKISKYYLNNGETSFYLHFESGFMDRQLLELEKSLHTLSDEDLVSQIMAYARQKKTPEDFLPTKCMLDQKAKRLVSVSGQNGQIGVVYSSKDFSSRYLGTMDQANTKSIGGFTVPKTSGITITPDKMNGKTDVCFRLDVSLKNYTDQIKALVTILDQNCDIATAMNVAGVLDSKTSTFDALVSYSVYDFKTGRFIWVRESGRNDRYIYVYACSVKWSTDYRKNVKEKYFEIISGFNVPLNIDLLAVPDDWGATADLTFSFDVLVNNPQKQITDLAAILLQKCDKSTVTQLTTYLKRKKDRYTVLTEKLFYDKKSGRYIEVDESRMDDVQIIYFNESTSRKMRSKK